MRSGLSNNTGEATPLDGFRAKGIRLRALRTLSGIYGIVGPGWEIELFPDIIQVTNRHGERMNPVVLASHINPQRTAAALTVDRGRSTQFMIVDEGFDDLDDVTQLSISVMAHPSRERYFPYLMDKLGNPPISVDEGWGIWENCKRAWQLHDPTARYHVVIQDDALIARDFQRLAEQEIERRPGHAFSFYWGNKEDHREIAVKGEPHGGVSRAWISWGVAICLPVRVIDNMINFCEKLPQNLRRHDDTMISRYVQHVKIPVWYPLPSLVDHRGEDSLMNTPPDSGNKAHWFAGE
jgi:hypothetical protein